MSPEVLAVLVAALDGENPRIRREPGRLVLNPRGEASDLDLTVLDLLYREGPDGRLRPRLEPAVAVKTTAQTAAFLVVEATAQALGHSMGEADRRKVADHLRRALSAIRQVPR